MPGSLICRNGLKRQGKQREGQTEIRFSPTCRLNSSDIFSNRKTETACFQNNIRWDVREL